MFKTKQSRWVWYSVLAAVVCGLFAPTMVASAFHGEEEVARCAAPDPT